MARTDTSLRSLISARIGRVIALLVAALLCVVLAPATALAPAVAYADDFLIGFGIWGDTMWELFPDGKLVFYSGTGESLENSNPPWAEYKESIRTIETLGEVVLPEDCSGMFDGCSNLVEADLAEFTTSNVTNMSRMFNGCTSLESLSLNGWDTTKVTNMSRMFAGCETLTELDISSFDTSNSQSMEGMFSTCFALQKLTVGDKFSFVASDSGANALLIGTSWHSQKDDAWYSPEKISEDRNNIADVYTRREGDDIARGTWGTCEWVLDSQFNLTIGPGTGADTIGEWLDGNQTWPYAERIKSVKTTGTVVLPARCANLFFDFVSMTSFDASGFDSSNVTNMNSMFRGCASIENLDLSSFDTSNVTDMGSMFFGMYDSTKLETINISSFDTSKVQDMSQMFAQNPSLRTVYAGEEWSVESATNTTNMFTNSQSIVGGNGTVYDSGKTDAEYAGVDADGDSGYLTFKAAPVTVAFVNWDGTVLQSRKIASGETPKYEGTAPTRNATAQYAYTFKGWTPEIASVTEDTTYTATYDETVRKYTVIFVNEDDTELLAAREYDYGTPAADIQKPADPTKLPTAQHTFAFAGWDPAITDVIGEVTYKATFKVVPEQGTLTFDLAGGELDGKTGTITIVANVGDTIKLPGAPIKEGYTFKYWKGSEYAAGADYTVEGDHPFTAEWEKNADEPASDDSAKPAVPATGDDLGKVVIPLSAAAGVALVALIGAAIKRRKA